MRPITVAWLAWTLVFVVLEAWAIHAGYRYTLTSHIRPIFLTWPILWFVGLGIWLWIGVHFLAPSLEEWVLDVVRRR